MYIDVYMGVSECFVYLDKAEFTQQTHPHNRTVIVALLRQNYFVYVFYGFVSTSSVWL